MISFIIILTSATTVDNSLKKFKILFLDDEVSLTKLAKTVFNDDFNIVTANTTEEAFSIINDDNVGIVISDFNMPGMDGIDFLSKVLRENPAIKRVLISGKIDLEMTLDSINKASINLVVEKPWNYADLKNQLFDLMNKFIAEDQEVNRVKELESKGDARDSEYYRHTDDLLDILSSLKESKKISEFGKHFLSVLEGVQSLTLVNVEFYLDTKDEVILSHAFQYLSDIEVIANQYDQKGLSVYVFLLRAYINGVSENYKEARLNYLGAQALYQWIKDSYISNTILEALEAFPIKDEINDISENPMIPRILEMHIKRLLAINIGDLINITESIFNLISVINSTVSYFVVIRNDIPVYDKTARDQDIEASLISGFVTALSQFLKETVKGSGDIDTISHNKGVILIHQQHDINYVLFLSVNDIRFRIALREFATQSYEIIKEVPENHLVSDNERQILDELADTILGEF